MFFVTIVSFVIRPRLQRVEGRRGAKEAAAARRSIARGVAGGLPIDGDERRWRCGQGEKNDDGRRRTPERRVDARRQRSVIDENRAPVIVVERGTRCAVGAPVRVLDCRRVVVIVIVVLRKVDVRRRQQRREDGRRHQQRCRDGPADAGSDHAGILSAEAAANF